MGKYQHSKTQVDYIIQIIVIQVPIIYVAL
jgi:hypothetical protein